MCWLVAEDSFRPVMDSWLLNKGLANNFMSPYVQCNFLMRFLNYIYYSPI